MASALQAQIDATIRTMRETINDLPEREERLDSFKNRNDGVSITSHSTCDETNKLPKGMCWKDIKGRIYLISSVIILILVIIVLPVVALMLQ